MADDYIVKSMSDAAVRNVALLTLTKLGTDLSKKINIISILNSGEIDTCFGRRRLILEQVEDDEMGNNDAQTSFARNSVSVQVRQIVMADAKRGIGRARMTLAHELGHCILHTGPTMGRRTLERKTPNYIAPHESAEHQAKVFASANLMPEVLVRSCKSVDEISKLAGVSYEAARIRWEVLNEKFGREAQVKKLRQLARDIEATSGNKKTAHHYLTDPCPLCQRQSLSPIGNKSFCAHCEKMFDRYQDGDSQD